MAHPATEVQNPTRRAGTKAVELDSAETAVRAGRGSPGLGASLLGLCAHHSLTESRLSAFKVIGVYIVERDTPSADAAAAKLPFETVTERAPKPVVALIPGRHTLSKRASCDEE